MIKISIFKDIEEDNYTDGETGKGFSYKLDSHEVKNLEDVLAFITDNYGTPVIFDDRLIVQTQENADGHAPNENQLAQFKDGEINLYSVTYNFYISGLVEIELNTSELLKNAFKTLDEV